MPPPESPQDVYARLLMRKDPSRGYPLYTPEPDESLPARYRKRGIRIGDLGVIAEDGGFDFLFNLCLPGDHEFNRVNGVPETFRQVDLRVGEEQDHEDVRVIRNADREGQTLSTCSTVRLNLDANGEGQAPVSSAGAGLGFHFSTSATEGAILVLPDGTEKRDLKNGLHKLQTEAKKNGRSWYQFVSCNLGRITNSDSLYVITGYHKASSWCLASFSQEEGSAAISLTLRAKPFIGVDVAAAYNWEMTNSVVGRVGPQSGYDKAQRNQAVFVRGFKIAIRERILAPFRGEVKVTTSEPPRRIDPSRPWNPERPHKGVSSSRPLGTNSRSSQGGHVEDDGDEIIDTYGAQEHHSDISIQHVPSSSSKALHPSDIINKFLLDKFPTADVAITHDSQWMDLPIESGECDLIERICKRFTPVYDPVDGAAYLQPKETAVECVSKPVDGGAPWMADFSGQTWVGPTTNEAPRASKSIDELTMTAVSSIDQDNDVVPPAHDHRTLVLCFDGSGDQFGTSNSNIVQLFSMLKKDDPSQQMVYYQTGIGTSIIPKLRTSFRSHVSKTIDMMVGNPFDVHLLRAYEFLMQNYVAGDKIYLFGFSRGAYTARALASMIHKVGLLPRYNGQQVPFAYKMYSQDNEIGWRQSTAFKKAFSISVGIEFVGVWDTVSSVGIIPRRLSFTETDSNIRYFRHAMALDERRVKQHYWHRPTNDDFKLGVKHDEMLHSRKKDPGVPQNLKLTQGSYQEPTQRVLEHRYSKNTSKTDVLEVWFAGSHSDVGGGSVANGARNSLARISLRWMIRECFKINSGILFHRSMFKEIGMDPGMLYPHVRERPPPIYYAPSQPVQSGLPGSMKPWVSNDTVATSDDGAVFVNEEEEDLVDALSPMCGQPTLCRWIVKVIPRKQRYQRDKDSCTTDITVDTRKGRHIPMQEINGVRCHRSVKIRMDADNLKSGQYVPRAKLKVEPKWID